MTTPRPYVIGLTGGIGCGKSAAADMFAELGAAVVDTDVIARELTAVGGRAIPAIRDAFGAHVLTPEGAMDRDAMRALAFSDPDARRRLEAILHPAIRAESAQQCGSASAPYVVLVVPLLLESGTYRERCDRICVVDCPADAQITRVMARSGLPEDQVRAIMRTQADRDLRIAHADDLIDNSRGLAELRARVEALHAQYLSAAAERSRTDS